jgi:HK97 family phage prohead protease
MPSPHHGAVVVDGIDEKAITQTADIATCTGYASIFGNKDLVGDVVMPGAYKKSLQEHGLPIILFNHRRDDVPVGTCIDAKEDKRGLWVKIELPLEDTFVSQRLLPQLRRKGLSGMSVGYSVPAGGSEWKDGVRYLKQIRLYECSFVSMPANPEAGVETIKDMAPSQLADALENMQLALNAFRDELQPDRVREIRETVKTMQAFTNEVRRQVQVQHPSISDPFARAETALRHLQIRLEWLRRAASR